MGISRGVVKFLEEGGKLQDIDGHCVAKNTISSFDLKFHGTDERHGCKSFTHCSTDQGMTWKLSQNKRYQAKDHSEKQQLLEAPIFMFLSTRWRQWSTRMIVRKMRLSFSVSEPTAISADINSYIVALLWSLNELSYYNASVISTQPAKNEEPHITAIVSQHIPFTIDICRNMWPQTTLS